MMRILRLKHRFIDHIPERLETGVLYVSMEYGTAAHSCCCGCNEEVVTPFSPTDWRMTYDGETVSLCPSIGNWTLPCRSHYVIAGGRGLEADPWTDQQIAAERRRDRAAKERHFGIPRPEASETSGPTPTILETPEPTGFWARWGRWFSRLWR